MKHNDVMTTIELKREELIDILVKEDFGTFELTIHAIEEYYLGVPFYDDDYQNYNNLKEQFEERVLKNRNGDPKFSLNMEQVLQRLFYSQISDAYVHLKKKVYEYFKEHELKDESEKVEMGDTEDYFDYTFFHYEQLNVEEEILDNKFNIIKLKTK